MKIDMDRLLYSKPKTQEELIYDNIQAPVYIGNLLTINDINQLNQIARSVKLSGKIEKKYEMINEIMVNRGFTKLAAGTNRVVYGFLEDTSFVVKIAIDKVGLGDNPAEYMNQAKLQPFCTKVFGVTPCGTVGFFERVDPITNRGKFITVANDVFEIISKVLIGKYVIDDFGTKYFMNWGLRKGFGPVILDFPYVYEIDKKKLFCNKIIDRTTGLHCDGEIDYDEGFNNLICTKCGKMYLPRDLKAQEESGAIVIKGGRKKMMKIKITKGDKVLVNTVNLATKTIQKPKPKPKKNKKLKVRIVRPGNEERNTMPKTDEEKLPDIPVGELSNGRTKEVSEEIQKPKEAIFNMAQEPVESEPDGEPGTSAELEKEEDSDMIQAQATLSVGDDFSIGIDPDEDEEMPDDEEDEFGIDYEDYLSNRDRSQDRNQTRRPRDGMDGF